MKESVMRSRPPRRAVPGAIAAGVFDLSVHFEGLANRPAWPLSRSWPGAAR